MDLTQTQYNKIKSFIIPTGTTAQRNAKRLGFDLAIRTNLSFERWENTLEKKGFSGINLTAPTSKSPARLDIVWTDDGVNGYVLNLDDTKINSLKSWLNNYNG